MNVFEIFCGLELDDDNAGVWWSIVKRWVDFDTENLFEGPRLGLPPAGRPEIVGKWIANARSPTFERHHTVTDLKAYEKQFWAWWAAVQPGWRTLDDGGRPRRVEATGDESWECLNVKGPNGLVNAVAALYFWGLAVAKIDADTYRTSQERSIKYRLWKLAADEVLFALKGVMCEFPTYP